MEGSSHCGDGGYDYEFVDTPTDHVICVICHLPSREAHMTECCGHVFCKSCLDRAKATQYKACSMCKDKEFNTFSNKQIDREVQGLHVYCTNKEKGCEWKGQVKYIRVHLENNDGCQFEGLKCPHGCEEVIERRFLIRHVNFECQHRKVECKYCHDKIKLLFVDGTHFQECPKVPLPCPNNCKAVGMILREDMEAHRRECLLEVIQCEYHGCEIRMLRKRQRKHDEENMEKHLCMTKDELASTKSELASTKTELTSRVNNLEMMVKLLTGSSSSDLSSVCSNPSLVAGQARWAIQLAAMESRSLLNDQTCPAMIKMTNFHDHEDDDESVWHKFFFSHERGYRMQLWVHPGRGRNEHVEVVLYLTQGPYDEDLQWPLRAKFQVTLLNQITDDEHISVTITYDDHTPNIAACRLVDEDDDSYPLDCNLISCRDIHKVTPTCAYLKNDCILLKVCKL